jgi:hypothetical protein
LWKRYATHNPQFLLQIALQLSGVSEYRHRRRERAWQRSAAARSSRRDEAGVSRAGGDVSSAVANASPPIATQQPTEE